MHGDIHECTKEEQLNRMELRLIAIDEGLRGNGKPGLFTEFAVWKNTVLGLVALDVIIISGLVAMWLTR
jgi:hypothetical protein